MKDRVHTNVTRQLGATSPAKFCLRSSTFHANVWNVLKRKRKLCLLITRGILKSNHRLLQPVCPHLTRRNNLHAVKSKSSAGLGDVGVDKAELPGLVEDLGGVLHGLIVVGGLGDHDVPGEVPGELLVLLLLLRELESRTERSGRGAAEGAGDRSAGQGRRDVANGVKHHLSQIDQTRLNRIENVYYPHDSPLMCVMLLREKGGCKQEISSCGLRQDKVRGDVGFPMPLTYILGFHTAALQERRHQVPW